MYYCYRASGEPFPKIPLGAIAQLVEHLHGMQGVRSSSLLGSIHHHHHEATGVRGGSWGDR